MFQGHVIFTDITCLVAIKSRYKDKTVIGLNFTRPLGPQLAQHQVPTSLELALTESYAEREFALREHMLTEAHLSHLYVRDTYSRSAYHWAENALRNAKNGAFSNPAMSKDHQPLLNKHVVIVGNGPSAVPLCISGFPDDTSVITCWHTYPRISDILTPAVICHVDKANLYDAVYDDYKNDIVFTPMAGHRFMPSFPNAFKYVYNSVENPYNQLVADVYDMPIHPPIHTNVGHMMCLVAALCGATKISLVGIDLAYEKPADGRIPLDNKYGNRVFTDPTLQQHLLGFVDFAANNPHIECVNLSTIGVDIAGWQ